MKGATNSYDLFDTLAAADKERIVSRLQKPRIYPKGTTILAPGEVQRQMYLVLEGIQMSHVETDKRSHVIAFTYPPNMCAVPESFALQQPSPCFLTCLTESRLSALSFDDLQAIFDESQAIERLFRQMTELLLAGIVSRHIELHTRSIEERFRDFCSRSPHLLQKVPHKYIASYLGMDATNFSKLYNTVKF